MFDNSEFLIFEVYYFYVVIDIVNIFKNKKISNLYFIVVRLFKMLLR